MSVSGPTTNHSEIRGWAAQHHARPAEVLPQRLDSEPAVLRIIVSGAGSGPPRHPAHLLGRILCEIR